MKKIISLLISGLLLNAISVFSQVKLNGPTCVLAEFAYSYYISFEGEYTGEFNICVQGGQLADSKEKCRSVLAGVPISINWNAQKKFMRW